MPLSKCWQQRSLKEVVKNREIDLGRGKIISHDDIRECYGHYPVYSSSVQNNGEIGRYGKYMFDEELITWSVDGGGNFFYRPKHKFSVTNVSGYLRIQSRLWDYKYLYYLLAWQHSRLSFDYTDKAHPSVIVDRYYVLDVPLPEQRRIAEILDTVDAAIQQTNVLIAKLKQMKVGLLHDLLTRGLDEHGQLRDPDAHPEQFKDSPLGRIPREWEIVRVRDVCNLGRGRVISQLEIDEHPGIYPVYSSQSKDEGVFGYLDTFDFEGEYVTWTTDGAYAGAVFYRSGRFNCTNVCGTLESKSDALSMKYLALALSPRTRKHVSYVGNPKLMNNVMAEIFVPIPSSQEQAAIVDAFDAHDTRIRAEEAYRDKLKQIKKGLMDDLLTGRVRVNVEVETPA
jgi:type I restriction enzyme S subunit